MLVMHQGQIIEDGATGEVIASPVHLYSQKLIEAVPRIDFTISTTNHLPTPFDYLRIHNAMLQVKIGLIVGLAAFVFY
ncbi:hypothetical protein ACT691_01195 [Vibrio metschnikovii]